MRRVERPPLSAEEIGFLTCVMDDPDDVTARRVYADWLQDRDDPRGPYMASAIARAAITAEMEALRGHTGKEFAVEYNRLHTDVNRLIDDCVVMVPAAIHAWLDWSGVLAEELAGWTKKRAVAGQHPWFSYEFTHGILMKVALRDGIGATPEECKLLNRFEDVIRYRMRLKWPGE
jgi:uncharacterized protein (TIGR02996 family)